ncbi:zinc-binding dehydrogenase [Gammaproteobacteria bacterium]|nr:zinc-binding dehydrogenase [Gammaproteobacteria bacterium]MDC3279335.1 zinc-binding dehydrogenase [Gammaproteobacteria bacterium]
MKIKIRKSSAAILVEQRKPLVIDEIELPEFLGVGQVLVKIDFSGICGSQIGEIDGAKGFDRYLPHLLGHEGAGKVIQTGPGISTVEEGDSVVMHWRAGSGIQSKPPVYSWRGNKLNAGFVTTFNRYAVVSENRLTKISGDFPKELATLFGCAVTTGIGVIENKGALKMGQSIVVVGAGGVGLNVIQGASLLSANPIVAVDLHQNRIDLAKKIGATHGVLNRDATWIDQVLAIVGPTGADLVVDNTGAPEVISKCIELTKSKGKTVLIGVPKEGEKTSISTLPLHFGKVLTGTHGGDGIPQEDIPRFLALSEIGLLDLSSLISGTYSLDRINDAIQDMRSASVSGRCLIEM